MARLSAASFNDVLTLIDETLWTIDPLGQRKDEILSVLIGRPLAVVQARLRLSFAGEPLLSQLWNDTARPDEEDNARFVRMKQTGNVQSVPFPVRLGSLELMSDGLIGYWLPDNPSAYSTFYAVHYPDQMDGNNTYVRRIVAQSQDGAMYQGGIQLQAGGPPITITMLIDPRAAVHAYSGILPVASIALPQRAVEALMKNLKVTFRTGPIVADPGTLRIPIPAEKGGVWTWIQAVENGGWEQDGLVDADHLARLPDNALELREGWLQLSRLENSD
jgi:hypothetical protein